MFCFYFCLNFFKIFVFLILSTNCTFEKQNNSNFLQTKVHNSSLDAKHFDVLQGKTQEQKKSIDQRGSMDPITSTFLLGRVDEQNHTFRAASLSAALRSIYKSRSSD